MSLTREVAEFATRLDYGSIPPAALERIKAGFVDCVGVMLEGAFAPPTNVAYRFASRRASAPPAFLGELALSTPLTGLVYGTASHAYDFDDTGINGHPSAILVPAIMADAEHRPVTGERMMAAYLAGFETWAELARRDRDTHHDKGWHPSPVFGVIAVTAAIANLRRLDVETTMRALGVAASSAAGLCANFGSMMKPFQLGRAIQFGIEAVDLAEMGLVAGTATLEHELGFLKAFSPKGDVDTASPARLGQHWEFLESGICIKLYPMCYATHRAIDAAVELMATHGLSSQQIETVEINLGPTQAAILSHHDPKTPLQAKFSAEFAVASIAVFGRCSQAELTDEALADPELRRLIAASKVVIDEERDPDYPMFSPADIVRVTLRDGRVVESQPVRRPRGHHEKFPSPEELWEKFRGCAASVREEPSARALFDALFALEEMPSISEVYARREDDAAVIAAGAAPLAGIVVIELGTSVAGPTAGMFLAELGATVVKVEGPRGDDARQWGPPFLGEAAATFQAINRNKQSLRVDFKSGEDLARLHDYIGAKADVVIQNLRPGVAEKFTLDAESLRKANPGLVYCNLSAFGTSGPLASMPGYDPLLQAFGGIMSVTGHEDAEPVRVGPSILDQGSGMWAAIGILAALLDRQRTGRGRRVDTSLFETALSWLCMHIAQYSASGRVPRRIGSENGGMVPYKAYEANDGWLVIAAANDGLFERFANTIGKPEWLTDERFSSNPSRVENRTILNPLIAEIIRTKPRQHWVEAFQRVQVPCAPIQTLEEVLSHEQTGAVGMYQRSPNGSMQLMGLPLRFDGVRPPFRSEPPTLGSADALLNKAAAGTGSR